MKTEGGTDLSSCDAIVLGGGITGITTAVVLQSLGLRVGIVSQSKPLQGTGETCSPLVPTGYAMASAYPHNLRVKDLDRISADSQRTFRLLSELEPAGVRVYRMFEVFEEEPEEAPLASSRMEFQAFDGTPAELKETIDPPIRPGAKHLWGWRFDTYFADMPRYLPFLWKMFEEQGGLFESRKVGHETVLDSILDKPIFNCLGIGAVEFTQDKASSVIMRGRQVLVPDVPLILGRDNIPVAYNYTPPAEVFQRADGTPEYVHFFPRSADWILGQTREPGELAPDGQWRGASTVSPEFRAASGEAGRRAIAAAIAQPPLEWPRPYGSVEEQASGSSAHGCSIPVPIVELNEILLQNWIGCTLAGRTLIGRVGYRYYRDPAETGVRLARDAANDRVIHNYGHGGSGVTMSWGCAIQCARLFLQAGGKMKSKQTNPLSRLIGKLCEGMSV